MSGKITSEVLESRLKCRYKGHLKMAGEQGQPHDYEILMKESREWIREAATARLLARHVGQDVASGVPLTVELLMRGLPLLLDTAFEGDDLSVRFDALLRVDGDSSVGCFHYQPVIFHEAEKTTPDLRLMLGIHGVVLGCIQGKEPAVGVLFQGRSYQERKLKLTSVAQQARRFLRDTKESLSGPPPRLLLNDHCQVCEFRQRCHAEATTKDDLSLLRAMSRKEISKYARRGIFTVTQLSCTFRPPRKKNKRSKHQRQPHQHALQALSIREKKTHVLGTLELPTSPTRIYFDIEGDPERGFDYLLGVIVEANRAEERYSFWADGPADEPRIFQQFLDLVGQYPDVWLYTYGGYEAAFLRRMAKGSSREKFVATIRARTFNVLSVIYPHFYFPTYSNGLKDIAGHMGFNWTMVDASGIQSIVWRRRWEETGSAALKETLTTYNLEDCAALRKVTEFLYKVCAGQPTTNIPSPSQEGPAVARVEEMAALSNRPEWRQVLAVPDFDFINKRAYFDYQRDKVFIRTNKALRKSNCRKRNRKVKKNLRANRHVEISSSTCNACHGTDLKRAQDTRLIRLAFDLRITRSGIRRWVTRFTTTWHSCAGCGRRFLPDNYSLLQQHFHSLKSWAMYEYVAHRKTQANIAETLQDCFGLPISTSQVSNFKQLLGRYYEWTFNRLLEKIVCGQLVHVDETEITLKKAGKGYVWVLTNMEEVVYLYRKSREGDFLHELLKGFRGVLVSDFYAAYESLPCEQQKCLIHLIRDINTEVRANPWDEELKTLASEFGTLLRAIVATIDQYGLMTRHMGKHRADVDKFFQSCDENDLRSEAAECLRNRLLRCQDKLFTFIGHDGVPWNNNNAENAVKRFAQYREITDGQVTEEGLKDYLVLLSVYQTCKYKGVSFLKFLLSLETDIDVFRENGGKKKSVSAIEIHAEGRPWLPNRKRVDATRLSAAGGRIEEAAEPSDQERNTSVD